MADTSNEDVRENARSRTRPRSRRDKKRERYQKESSSENDLQESSIQPEERRHYYVEDHKFLSKDQTDMDTRSSYYVKLSGDKKERRISEDKQPYRKKETRRPPTESDDLYVKRSGDEEERRISVEKQPYRKKEPGRPPTESDPEEEAPIYHISESETDPHVSEESSGIQSAPTYTQNIMLWVILGYVVGIIVVLLWYYRHPHKAKRDLNSMWFLIVFFVLLLLVLSYSRAMRCVLALTLPTLSSYKGRALLIALAFFVAATGPVMNIIDNIGIMAHSLSCGQWHLREALLPMLDIMGEPVYAVEHAVYITMSEVRRVMDRLEQVLERLEIGVLKIVRAYKTCSEWLLLQGESFDKQMGTPYDRCIGAGRISIRECQLKFGAKKPVCNAQQRFEWFCGNLKELKTFFENTVQLQQQIVNEIFQRLQESFIKIRHIFEVSITFDHTHHQNNSKTMNSTELNRELDMQMNSQMQEFLLAFVWLDVVFSLLIISVVLRSIYFRMRYLSSDEYCNVYLTHEFFSLDEELQRVGGPTALPLRSAEKVKYVELTSMRLLPNELSKMSQSVLFMIITSVQLFCICYTEYSLFWMLALMSYHSHKMAGLEAPPYTKIVIKRGGTIGEILRGLVHAFEPLGTKYSIDTTECLPTPVPPNFVRYYEIVVLCLLAWFLLFWEPYGLRLRHRIMSCFYPDASHKRAQYLHQRIVNDRGNFVKLARRRARALHLYADRNDAFWCLTWCCKIFGWGSGGFLGYSSGDICIICSKPLKRSEAIKCNTIGCKGIFCQLCFYESNYHCCLCSPPSSYGDYSDLSEIGDSSDDPDAEPFRPDNIYCGNASFDTLRKKSP